MKEFGIQESDFACPDESVSHIYIDISQFNCIHYNTVEYAWVKKLPFPVARTLQGTDLLENTLLALRTSDSRADFPAGVCFRLLEQQPA